MMGGNIANWEGQYAYDAVAIIAGSAPSADISLAPSRTDVATKHVGFWIGVTGNLQVELESGASVTFENVPIGWFWCRAVKVLHTSTTVTQVLAVFLGM